MHRIVKGAFIVVLGMSVARAQDERRDKPATPAEQYQALLKESQNAPDDLSRAKTAEERKQVVARLGTLPLRFLELAEKHPKDPVALDALIQAISLLNGTAFPAGGKDRTGDRALALLRRDHVHSDRLGPVCQQVVFGFHRSHETFRRGTRDDENGAGLGYDQLDPGVGLRSL
jgi:hypothetical protein